MICIAVDNVGYNNAAVRSCHSAHQAVSKFTEDHIDMVIRAHHKPRLQLVNLVTLISRLNMSP